MVDNIVYGDGGVPMVKQPNEVKPVEKNGAATSKKKRRQPLQEIYGEEKDGDDGFDEEHGDKE